MENADNWFLKKHENGEVFGPVKFSRIAEWARSAHVNPQDMLSNDRVKWTKAPMIPELHMDWLIVVGEDLLYGPTTAGTLLEFSRLGEIAADTQLINCGTGEPVIFNQTDFYEDVTMVPEAEEIPPVADWKADLPAKGNIKYSLQQRVRELETALLEKRLQLTNAQDTIKRQQAKIKMLEERIRDFSGLRRS